MSARAVRTPKKALDAFIAALASGATVAEACAAAGIGRRTAYDHRRRDEAFALRWADAVEEGTEALEREAIRRAMEGSDTLLIFLLKARRPNVYRDRVSVDQTTRAESMRVSAPSAAERRTLLELGRREPELCAQLARQMMERQEREPGA